MLRHLAAVALTLVAIALELRAQVLVNQSGYNTIGSKRFTAPLAADGMQFSIVTEPGGEVAFTGTVAGGVGDFSALEPAATGEFRVLLGEPPAQESSHPFGIGPFWIERVSYQRMIHFFIDSRSGFGDATSWDVSHGRLSSGIAWRDSHQFSFELRTLIQWYAANPDAFGTDRMPVDGVYLGLRDTLPGDTPEIVRLVHWGVDLYLRGNLNHTLIKEELAYFLYYYPLFQQWIPLSLYQEARDYLFPRWGNTARDRWNWYDITHTANLFQTYTVMGGTKGALPPGHSIVPNLLMHGVALREGRGDAADYLAAARDQTQWIVNNLDPANPLVTKGQRMSEHILLPALVEFMLRDPSGPVAGVDAWIASWADIVIARSENLWDFRKFSDTIWTPENPGSSSHPWWNEPGNVAGFPASALAAASRLADPVKIERLRAIGVSHNDQVFGRNPHNRHYSFRAAQPGYGFEGVETGWFSQHNGGLGILGNTRGVLDASAKHPAFPYNPNVHPGYVEGWVAFNSAWNAAMVWAARDRSSIRFIDPDSQGAVGADGLIEIELIAPLNFNRNLAETALVRVTSASGDVETVALTETGAATAVFRGVLLLDNHGPVAGGDGILQAAADSIISAAYAHDIFARSTEAAAADTAEAGLIITTSSLPVARVATAYVPFALAAFNATPPLSWQIVQGSSPSGMQLLADGTLQGTPDEPGVFPLVIRATDANSHADRSSTLSCSGLTIATHALAAAAAGVPYSQPLQSTGALGSVVWSLAAGSALPAGLAIHSAGTISGTTFEVGDFIIEINATDEAGVSVSSSLPLLIHSAAGGLRFIDTFDAGTGAWFKATSGGSLTHDNGRLRWAENGSMMAEAIGRPFAPHTLVAGQTLRLTFDFAWNTGSTTTGSAKIIRAGLFNVASPINADNWSGANAIGAWDGYYTFVRDGNATGNLARRESSASASASNGPTNGSGTITQIGSDTTNFNINDNATVIYRGTFDVTRVSDTRIETLFTLKEGEVTRFSVPGSQTSASLATTFNTVVFKTGANNPVAFYDNVRLEVIGGGNPAWFVDWQDLVWPGVSDEELAGPLADPDFDGLPNVLEWALHLDPLQSSPFAPELTSDGEFMLFTYTRRKIAPGQVSFHVEWSDTLAADSWSELEVVAAPPDSIDGTRESVTSAIPLGGGPRRFIRIRLDAAGVVP